MPNSQWNGKYGSEESKRRSNYDRGVDKLKMRHAFGIPSLLQHAQKGQAREIDEAVPRKKE